MTKLKIPYFLAAGFVLIVSMMLYTVRYASFLTFLLPIYLTEFLAFLVLDLATWDKFKKGSFIAFLMPCFWFLNQVLTWTVSNSTIPIWLIFVAQIGLIAVFLMGLVDTSETWTYAGGIVMLFFGVAKAAIDILVLGVASNTGIMMVLWGFAIALMSFGYVLRPVSKRVSDGIQLVGVLFAIISALAIQNGGLGVLVPPF